MMKSLLSTIICCISFNLTSAQYDAIRKEVNKLIRYETRIDYAETPGIIVGMIDGDSTYILSFGQRALEDHSAILKDDVFELAGVSKLFSAMIAIGLVHDQKIKLNQPMNDFLPIKNTSCDSITLFKLLTHTSGFPKFPPGWGDIEKDSRDPYSAFNRTELNDFYKNFHHTRSAEGVYLYSHLNYAMIQWIIESVSSMEYEDLLKKYIPTEITVSTLKKTTIPGYGMNMKPSIPWTSQAYLGSIGIRGSLIDLMNTCKAFLKKPVIFEEMLKTYPGHVGKINSYTALGWLALPIPKNRFVYAHTGKTKGHHTFIGILPETNTGVVVLANSVKGSDILGISILNMMNKNWKRKSIDPRIKRSSNPKVQESKDHVTNH